VEGFLSIDIVGIAKYLTKTLSARSCSWRNKDSMFLRNSD